MSALRSAQFGRVLVVALVLLTLVGGAGVTTADTGNQCPPQTGGENPTRAYEHVTETAVESSADGRSAALLASGCIDADADDPSAEYE